MAYDAKAIEIIIASPRDVAEERKIVRDVVAEWNAVYARDRKVALMPVGWESHTSPELSGRPQQMINDRLLTHADILVGIFWTRVGSPTGKAISGSIEEIEEHMKRGKPVMLYFSDAPVALGSVDPAQYDQLKGFKAWASGRGLVESFESRDDFREKFTRQLPITLRENAYLKGVLAESISSGWVVASGVPLKLPERVLSEDAREVLMSAGKDDRHGTVIIRRHVGGTDIRTSEKTFGEPDNRRSVARWEAAVAELRDRGLLRDINGKGQIFEVTDAGYHLAESAINSLL